MKPKRKFKQHLSIEIDNFGVSKNDNLIVYYSGYFKGKKVLSGEYEFLEQPETGDELMNELLKEIDAVVKGYGNGVKH